jgi:hypothetical protein
MNNLSIDELLNKAFLLASFIIGDREDALRTVAEAMTRLDVTTAAQGKRLYYKPSPVWIGRDRGDRYRNKVLFSEMHLLQRLVYIASEPYEKRREQAATACAAGEDEMLIHFIKHLVRITTKRNSFYVTLGLSRLLYNYTTAETMEVYNAVIQDPERVKDDYYYRSRKGVLMQELKKRFDHLVEVARGPRGEERFRASDNQSRFTELVRECLSFFTPWYTPCLVPAGVNPIMDGIAGLSSHGQQEEDKIEVDRIHAILHPDCHQRLIKSLGYDPPDARLEVPHFFLSQDNGNGEGTRGERRRPTGLGQSELAEIKGHLDDQSARRKRAFAGLLRVLVDGEERARLDLARSSDARFNLEDDAELIEVRAMKNGDDLLLASHLLTHHESSKERASTSIVLEGGQKLTLTFSHATDETGAIVNVAYSETNPLRSASLFLRQRMQLSGAEESSGRTWNLVRLPALALGLAFLALCAMGIAQLIKNRNSAPSTPAVVTNNQPDKPGAGNASAANPTDPTPVVTQSPLVTNAPPVTDEQKNSAPKKLTPPATTQSPQVAAANDSTRNVEPPRQPETVARDDNSNDARIISPERSAPETDTTRSFPSAASAASLSEVRKIYVEFHGDAALAKSVRAKLIESLSASERFLVAESRDEADALLKLFVTNVAAEPEKISVRAELINAQGVIIWRGDSGKYTNEISSVAAGIVRDLLDEASGSKGRH